MGVHVVVGGAGDHELAAIRRLFEQRDARFSRFRPDSELSRVNACQASSMVVSPPFAEAVRLALGAAAATGGLVDPTLGAALEAAGYDCDFGLVREDDPRPPASGKRGAWRSVRLDGRVLRRPVGMLLDLNGVVKARAVDDAVALLEGPGFVAAGGDVATRGPVDVELPGRSTVRVDGGIATSGTTRCRWVRAGEVQHHLIDAGTGRPAFSRWETVTVVARTCLDADVAAKAAFFLSGRGPGWLDDLGLAGRFVSGTTVMTNARWENGLVGLGAEAA
jgi:FAD:protein FMN transferase